MAHPVYLSPHASPLENFMRIVWDEARTTRSYEAENSGFYGRKRYSNMVSTALLAGGFVLGKLASWRQGIIGVAAALIGQLLYTYFTSKEGLKKEDKTALKIYQEIIEDLAPLYVAKTNLIFGRVQSLMTPEIARDIEKVFAIVKEQVDLYDEQRMVFDTPQDAVRNSAYVKRRRLAIELTTGPHTVDPLFAVAALSSFCMDFAYGCGHHPIVWPSSKESKKYFLRMDCQSDGTWAVRKYKPPLLLESAFE